MGVGGNKWIRARGPYRRSSRTFTGVATKPRSTPLIEAPGGVRFTTELDRIRKLSLPAGRGHDLAVRCRGGFRYPTPSVMTEYGAVTVRPVRKRPSRLPPRASYKRGHGPTAGRARAQLANPRSSSVVNGTTSWSLSNQRCRARASSATCEGARGPPVRPRGRDPCLPPTPIAAADVEQDGRGYPATRPRRVRDGSVESGVDDLEIQALVKLRTTRPLLSLTVAVTVTTSTPDLKWLRAAAKPGLPSMAPERQRTAAPNTTPS